MLENQILVVGLDGSELERLNQVRDDDFIFISIPSIDKIKPVHFKLQGLIFKPTEPFEVWGDLLNAFQGKCAICISDQTVPFQTTTFMTSFKALEVESYLSTHLGDLRSPPADVGMLETGTVVKNKIFPSWGLGVITKVGQDDVYEVRYPKMPKNLKTNVMSCHKSQLRIICDIKEIDHEKVN